MKSSKSTETTKKHSFESQHIYSIASYLKSVFGKRIAKLSINAHFTCPNRDGVKGYGGCAFCSSSGGGYYASDIESQIDLLKDKWPDADYLAYFQSNSNTYASVDKLRAIYDAALAKNVKGLVISTRADCLGKDVLDLLDEYNKKSFMWLELGLQTSNVKNREVLNLCMDLSEFENGVRELNKRNIKTVFHIIAGLPGETEEDFIGTVKYAIKLKPFGIKIHMFHLLEGSILGNTYENKISLLSREEYVRWVVNALEIIPSDIVIHRLTGDPPESGLIAPLWARDKRRVLNDIQKEFRRRGSFQGIYSEKGESV